MKISLGELRRAVRLESKKMLDELTLVQLRSLPDEKLSGGYGRSGDPKYLGKHLSSQPSWPYTDQDEETVADKACCSSCASGRSCELQRVVEPKQRVKRKIAGLGSSVSQSVGDRGSRDNFAFVTGATKLGEAGHGEPLERPVRTHYQSIYTLAGKSARGDVGSLAGWSRPIPNNTVDDEPLIDLIDLLDADDDWRDSAGHLSHVPAMTIKQPR